ncbi:TetR/AcrR family transcriptional regulator [Brevibacterium atlanticum]|uniref:TetR/AcrR family transcriptional regulator n=1 Tax=Brevibacterium atlanticum TaxID=2697563 RepID=UPI001AA19A50|nr:TetR family transcriptional regulator [Brevibacterium atlanticum]
MGLSPVIDRVLTRCYDDGMPRWTPNARDRLVVAALDMFAENGFDGVTVAEISARAGLTKSTFFRYFPDKREVLAAGQDEMLRLLVDGISSAPAEVGPLEAVRAGLDEVSSSMTPFHRELGPRIRRVISENVELQERDAAKHRALTDGMASALQERGVERQVAIIAAHLGTVAFGEAYAAWIDAGPQTDLSELAHTALTDLGRAAGTLAD